VFLGGLLDGHLSPPLPTSYLYLCVCVFSFWKQTERGGASQTGLLSNRSRDDGKARGRRASIGPGSHYTETARKRGSETERKIKGEK